MFDRIGFMQGRLSPMVNGKIQAFPWEHWESEFAEAGRLGIPMMEWTLDHEGLRENPLVTAAGQKKISALQKEFSLRIPSLTGDCFMQAPYYKKSGPERTALIEEFRTVMQACEAMGVEFIVFPLVDGGRLENITMENEFVESISKLTSNTVRILFESDYEPKRLRAFMQKLPGRHFGINYDIGNSASLGFDPTEEISCYGEFIQNVHVKDRVKGGTTVPLGTGNADFSAVFAALKKISYQGNFILQTARAANGDHAGVLKSYAGMVEEYLDGSRL